MNPAWLRHLPEGRGPRAVCTELRAVGPEEAGLLLIWRQREFTLSLWVFACAGNHDLFISVVQTSRFESIRSAPFFALTAPLPFGSVRRGRRPQLGGGAGLQQRWHLRLGRPCELAPRAPCAASEKRFHFLLRKALPT